MTGHNRYPHALKAIAAVLANDAAHTGLPDDARRALTGTSFVVGPAVLRAPPALSRPAPAEVFGEFVPQRGPNPQNIPRPKTEDSQRTIHPDRADLDTNDKLGELVDMVLVGSAEDSAGGQPEVHLLFKASVFGGLHLRLRKTPAGMHALFTVEDATSRRLVAAHIDDLVHHLNARGIAVASHEVQVGTVALREPA